MSSASRYPCVVNPNLYMLIYTQFTLDPGYHCRYYTATYPNLYMDIDPKLTSASKLPQHLTNDRNEKGQKKSTVTIPALLRRR